MTMLDRMGDLFDHMQRDHSKRCTFFDSNATDVDPRILITNTDGSSRFDCVLGRKGKV